MNNFEKLLQVKDKLKKDYKWGGNLTIEFSPNTSNYESIYEFFEDERLKDFSSEYPDIVEGCINNNSLVEIMCFPFTPNGHYISYGKTLDEASMIMLKELEMVKIIGYVGFT